jgi:hypothetical protein
MRPIAHGWDILFESGRCDWDEWRPSAASRINQYSTFTAVILMSEAKDLRNSYLSRYARLVPPMSSLKTPRWQLSPKFLRRSFTPNEEIC